MTEATILETVARNIRIVSEASADRPIEAGSRLVEDVGLDSLDLVSLLMQLQDEFGVEFDLDEVGKIRHVGDVIEIVHALQSRAA